MPIRIIAEGQAAGLRRLKSFGTETMTNQKAMIKFFRLSKQNHARA
jgi:hypothetical protein